MHDARHPDQDPRGRDVTEGRVRSLADTARCLKMLGCSNRLLEPYEVLRIEQRALRKVKRERERRQQQ